MYCATTTLYLHNFLMLTIYLSGDVYFPGDVTTSRTCLSTTSRVTITMTSRVTITMPSRVTITMTSAYYVQVTSVRTIFVKKANPRAPTVVEMIP